MTWLNGNRKLVAFSVAMLATIGLALIGKLDETSAAAIAGLLALFVGGNAAEHIRKPSKSVGKDKDGEE